MARWCANPRAVRERQQSSSDLLADDAGEGGTESRHELSRNIALSEVGGTTAAEAVLGQRIPEDRAAVEPEIEAARENDARRSGLFRAKDSRGTGHGRGEAGGEEANVVAIPIFPAAVNETQAVFDLNFHGEAAGLIVGELFAHALALFG